MPRRKTRKTVLSENEEDEAPPKVAKSHKSKLDDADSSSDSDIGNYLHRADDIDLNSSFFNKIRNEQSCSGFNKIENDILAGISRLSDSECDDDAEMRPEIPSTSKLNFQQLHDYKKKMEDVKHHVEKYTAAKQAERNEINISSLLAAGESKNTQQVEIEEMFHSSDFETCSESEREDWEEVGEKQSVHVEPRDNLQITVEMPGAIRKKKSVDLLAAIKRRINRVRKEHQVLVHKVHLLCWLAYGNYVSSVINSQNILAVALSLLPSQQCYPANRTDLAYLEQILKWYSSAITNAEKSENDNSLNQSLEAQISRKVASDKKMLVYIFVAVLRSLGIQCRLVLSLQVEPLRPPTSELHSLSTKTISKTPKKKDRAKSTSDVPKLAQEPEKVRAASSSEGFNAKMSRKEVSPTKSGGKSHETLDKETKSPKCKSKKDHKTINGDGPLQSIPKENLINGNKKGASKVKTKDTVMPETKKQSLELIKTSKDKEKKANTKIRKSARSKTNEEHVSVSGESKKSKNAKPKGDITESTSQKQEKPSTTRRLRSERNIIPQVDGADDTEKSSKPNLKRLKQKETSCSVKEHSKRLKAPVKYRDSDSEDDFTSNVASNKMASATNSGVNLKKLKNVKSVDVRKDVMDLVKGRIKEQKDIDRMKTVRKRKSPQDDDDNYVPKAIKKKQHESEDEFVPKIKVKTRVQVKREDEDTKSTKRQGVDVWAEVFLESEEKWISVDVVKGQVHCVNELYARATHPVCYIVAWNNDNTIKDITRRYCQNFNTITRKLRVETKWWDASWRPFAATQNTRDREEDDELERQQLDKPLPTSITEYKNHPLYVLKRHLLKFEALYPSDAPTLGFVRKEPVYARQCVYNLHSRDIWLKHAKVVRPGEQPYKIVKARPRWDKLSNSIVTGEMLEIFGPWQTQDYEPPTAENGVVPRNAFGNVELFKACMLPKKTAHLQLPGLNKVAKRMNIDCAPALVGFDFHAGWSHPTYDGFVVCEEYADILVAAWELEQDELEKKEREKIDKRVYGNWKRLIRGLLIRERLKAKYDFGEPSGGKKKGKGGSKLLIKNRKIGSDSD